MANVNEEIIKQIREKEAVENHDLGIAYNKNDYFDLSKTELYKHKANYSKEEIDFVINNYERKNKYSGDKFLGNCIYLLDEYKMTKQTSKCNAIYKILKTYYSIDSYYDVDDFRDYSLADRPEWKGFQLVVYYDVPAILKELINEKVIKIKSEKKNQSRIESKKKLEKKVQNIIGELEL